MHSFEPDIQGYIKLGICTGNVRARNMHKMELSETYTFQGLAIKGGYNARALNSQECGADAKYRIIYRK